MLLLLLSGSVVNITTLGNDQQTPRPPSLGKGLAWRDTAWVDFPFPSESIPRDPAFVGTQASVLLDRSRMWKSIPFTGTDHFNPSKPYHRIFWNFHPPIYRLKYTFTCQSIHPSKYQYGNVWIFILLSLHYYMCIHSSKYRRDKDWIFFHLFIYRYISIINPSIQPLKHSFQ